MLADAPVLAEVAAEGWRFGVRRDFEGENWFSAWPDDDPSHVCGVQLNGFEPDVMLDESGWIAAAGGLAPHGTRRVRVRSELGAWHDAVVGDGAWAIRLAQRWQPGRPGAFRDLPVQFLDDRGALISRVTPHMDAASRRVGPLEVYTLRLGTWGAPRACPVCDGKRWRAVRVGYESGERIFCRRCGHSESGGGEVIKDDRGFWRRLRAWRSRDDWPLESMSFPSGRPSAIALAVVPGLAASGAPAITVEVTNLTSDATAVLTCGVNVSTHKHPDIIPRVSAHVVDPRRGERHPVAPGATIALIHEFDEDDQRLLAAQHVLPPALEPTLGVWAQAADGETTFSASVAAHTQWRHLGWNPPSDR
jgi:hypothetical protein